MALLWCDGFDHYGDGATGKSNMLEGPYAELGSSTSNVISTANPRTGARHWRSTMFGASISIIRRVLGGDKVTVGIGAALYFSNMPTNNGIARLYDFRNNANESLVRLVLQTTGALLVAYPGGIFTTDTPVVVAEAYQHIEMMVGFSSSTGWLEVRVNGVTVIALSDINTGATLCAQVAFLYNSSSSTATGIGFIDMDDLFCYDGKGSFNNTFIGDRRVITLFPTADTISADFTPVGSATGFGAINQTTPDDDTTYITSATVGDESEFEYANLPGGISSISAVVSVAMSRKTDAGPTNLEVAAVSGASVTPGTDRPLTERYTYWQDVFETDPASAAPFTPAEVNAMKLRFKRTL